MDGLSDIEWPRGLYVGCLGYLIITAFLIAVWVAGFVICIAWWAFLQFHVWGLQILVLIVAAPFAVIYALQRQKRQHQLARELECQYYAERGNAQVSVDDFKAWVREQENK
jgi:membrane protein implicated in regulation of membrane protease activity